MEMYSTLAKFMKKRFTSYWNGVKKRKIKKRLFTKWLEL